MVDSLLSHRINTLLLNANAPFPSEVRDGRELVRNWRMAQRLRLVDNFDAVDHDSDPADCDHSDDEGGNQ